MSNNKDNDFWKIRLIDACNFYIAKLFGKTSGDNANNKLKTEFNIEANSVIKGELLTCSFNSLLMAGK